MDVAVVSKDELEQIIHRTAALAVSELRDELAASKTPELMNRQQLAAYLQCHEATVSRQMQAGMPYEMLGDHPRFRKADIDVWLQGKNQNA